MLTHSLRMDQVYLSVNDLPSSLRCARINHEILKAAFSYLGMCHIS